MTEETPKKTSSEDNAVTVNTNALQAMANPTRMRILGTLRVNGAQTVGSISSQLNEAPGAISYHLKQLEQAGLAEKITSPDGDRRKSWWKARQTAIKLDSSVDDTDTDTEAIDQFRRSAALTHEMAYERYLDKLPQLPQEWTTVCTSDDHVIHLTSTQTQHMINELNTVIHRWQNIATTHNTNNTDTKPVAITLQTFLYIP